MLHVGEQVAPDDLARWLVDYGFKRTEVVELPGEFSRRGGIVDVFSPDAETPCRLEFFGDTIESIRSFSPYTQRSLGNTQTAEVMTAGPGAGNQCLSEKGTGTLKARSQSPFRTDNQTGKSPEQESRRQGDSTSGGSPGLPFLFVCLPPRKGASVRLSACRCLDDAR